MFFGNIKRKTVISRKKVVARVCRKVSFSCKMRKKSLTNIEKAL